MPGKLLENPPAQVSVKQAPQYEAKYEAWPMASGPVLLAIFIPLPGGFRVLVRVEGFGLWFYTN